MNRTTVTCDGCGKIGLIQEPIPEPKDNEILIEVKASLISAGTQLSTVQEYRNNPDTERKIMQLGYQNSGVVVKRGPGCENIPVGARIAAMGSGARHTSHSIIPRNLAMPIPDEISFQEASYINLIGTAVQAVRRADVEFGQHIVVAGLGVVGQLCCQFGTLAGTHVMGLDRLPLRLDIARKCGAGCVINGVQDDPIPVAAAFTRGYGMDAGIIAFGGDGTPVFEQMMKMLKLSPDGHRMGCVVNVGGAEIRTRFGAKLGNADIRSSARTGPGYHDDAWEQGRDYPGCFVPWTTRRNVEEIFRFATEKRVDLKSLITHEFALADAANACDLILGHPAKTLGVVLIP